MHGDPGDAPSSPSFTVQKGPQGILSELVMEDDKICCLLSHSEFFLFKCKGENKII